MRDMDDDLDEYLLAISAEFPDATAFKRGQQHDPSIRAILDAARSPARGSPFIIFEDLLYKKNYSAKGAPLLFVVPQTLRPMILHSMHNDITSGHLDFARTLHRLRQRFYWPKLWKTVKQCVSSCAICQLHKQSTTPPAGALQPVKPPPVPFEKVGVDLLGPFPSLLPVVAGLLCVEYLTRYTETAALVSATAADVSSFLLYSVILRHGAPRVVIGDRGRQFTADFVQELLRLCGSHYRQSTPYHPQTNGLNEDTNRTLTNMLSMYVSTDHKNWDSILPFVTYAYNTAKHEVTGYAPFFLLYARNPQSFIDAILPWSPHNDYSLGQTLCHAEEARRLTRLRTLSSQDCVKTRYGARHVLDTYAPGDFVWLWTTVRKKGLCTKFVSIHWPIRLIETTE